MVTEGITTRLQKDMALKQNELTLLQAKFNHLDTMIDAHLKDFQEGIKNKVCSGLHSKIHSLFEQYFDQIPTIVVIGLVSNKGKGI
ncbi:hypothetical protein PVK06_018140 [Gossypium arboreum]|uniref:Uncharacterized protein n=1 Tax=Gossypium arboreum TaxID=29729 RepID=A0ABR0Q5V4_GOSAR|nr:hypothetical protein PVK06_018140 [Gossypium arboreum]